MLELTSFPHPLLQGMHEHRNPPGTRLSPADRLSSQLRVTMEGSGPARPGTAAGYLRKGVPGPRSAVGGGWRGARVHAVGTSREGCSTPTLFGAEDHSGYFGRFTWRGERRRTLDLAGKGFSCSSICPSSQF